MPCPARLIIVADAGRREQGGIDQRAGAHHHPAAVELTRDGLEQSPVQAAAHQLGPEADKGGALGRGLVCRKAQKRRKLARSSRASAKRTSERSCQVASRSALKSASGGQPGSPLAEAE